MPAISVIMPIYNVEPYLRECLDSILAQTFRDFEVLAVDDGSTDSSGAILDEYAAKDSRVKPIHQANAGAAAARNNGMAQAQGKYLMFLDSDDFFEPDMLEKMYQKAEETNADIVSCTFTQFDAMNGEETGTIGFAPEILALQTPFSLKNDLPDLPLDSFFCVPWIHLVKKIFLEKHHIAFQDLPRCNDVAFSFLCLAHAERMAVIDLPFVHYRVGGANHLQSPASRNKHPFAFWDALSFTKRKLEDVGLYGTFKSALAVTAWRSVMAN